MIIIGLSGGIGSGKSTIAKWFSQKGIAVYNSDDEAKKLIDTNPELIEKLSLIFGEETYKDGIYNRAFVASKVFENKELLQKLNAAVHPVVFEHFDQWIKNQKSDFVIKEAAILFESGSYKNCDSVISVIADEEKRIQRVIKRDGLTESQIRSRIKNQWTDSKTRDIVETEHDLVKDFLRISFTELKV